MNKKNITNIENNNINIEDENLIQKVDEIELKLSKMRWVEWGGIWWTKEDERFVQGITLRRIIDSHHEHCAMKNKGFQAKEAAILVFVGTQW